MLVRVPAILVASLWVATAGTTGCSNGSVAAGAPPVPVIAAAITQQPADQSVPMGLAATFAVAATGSALQYQWAKDGVPIAGATASSYTTPLTAFANSGASFTVAVSNADGAVTSSSQPTALSLRRSAPPMRSVICI